jgi:mono/diheme cytochrome c family protein
MRKAILVFVLISVSTIAGIKSKPVGSPSTKADAERGKYLVENVSMCGQCHTPRGGNGELIRSQWLNGAPIPTPNPYPDRPWSEFAPRISGLLQYSDDQALQLLTEGTSRTGKPLRGPMPPFRMSDQDARDIISYLRSLK